jgi:hypothetical protein
MIARMGRSFAFALLALTALSLPASAGPECRCLYNGRAFEHGALVCIRLGSSERLARCDMELNNSSWTFLQNGCPTAMTPLPPEALRRLAVRG